MPSYRCSICNIDWGTDSMNQSCPQCGGDTWRDPEGVPTKTTLEANEVRRARIARENEDEAVAELATPSPAYANRVERYLALGFNEVNAHRLAQATVVSTTERRGKTLTWRTPLHHAKVAAALEAGCSHDLAVSIYA